MGRKKSATLTERESQIMTVLWQRGSASAQEVQAALAAKLRDSTVRTLLGILEEKGYVRHRVKSRTYIYKPVVPRAQVQKSVVRRLLDGFFDGSAASLVQRFLEDKQLTPEQLDELKRKYQKGEKS